MKPAELLTVARSIVTNAPKGIGADRTIAAALLTRQALELAVDQWWAASLPPMAAASDRAQQITMRFFAPDDVASNVIWAWTRLSTICHHHAYAMPPTDSEIHHLIEAVERFAATAPSK